MTLAYLRHNASHEVAGSLFGMSADLSKNTIHEAVRILQAVVRHRGGMPRSGEKRTNPVGILRSKSCCWSGLFGEGITGKRAGIQGLYRVFP